MKPSRSRSLSRLRRAALLGTLSATFAAGLTGGLAPSAAADVERCVGAVTVPGGFACYTSPRFDHLGIDRSQTMDVPPVCFGLFCTQEQLEVWRPADTAGGRFISVLYLGHSYTVYRPADESPYLLSSTNPRLTPLEEAQVVLYSNLVQD